MKKIWILVIVVAALFALWVVAMYINLAMSEESVKQALVQIENAREFPGDEGRVRSAEWENYNRLVDEYNLSLEKFPGSVFARMFGFYRLEHKTVPDAGMVPDGSHNTLPE